MLAEFLFQLKTYFFGFNVFRYITVKAALAAVTALLFSFVIGPRLIRLLQQHHIGEEIRHDGPKSHLSKQGTPTMGGLIIIVSFTLSVILWADIFNPYVFILLFASLALALVGFIDDYLKTVKKLKKGLVSKYKLIGQIAVGLVVGSLIYFHPFTARL